MEDLSTKLPLSSNFQDFPASLQSLLTKFSEENPSLAESLKLSYSDEPWRQFVLFLQGKLPVTTGEVEEVSRRGEPRGEAGRDRREGGGDGYEGLTHGSILAEGRA